MRYSGFNIVALLADCQGQGFGVGKVRTNDGSTQTIQQRQLPGASKRLRDKVDKSKRTRPKKTRPNSIGGTSRLSFNGLRQGSTKKVVGST